MKGRNFFSPNILPLFENFTPGTLLSLGNLAKSHFTILIVHCHLGPFFILSSDCVFLFIISISFSSVIEELESNKIPTFFPLISNPIKYSCCPSPSKLSLFSSFFIFIFSNFVSSSLISELFSFSFSFCKVNIFS